MSDRQLQLLICKPAGWREDFADPTVSGWTIGAGDGESVECDGDILRFTKGPTANWYDLRKTGLNIDSDDYPYVAFRAKKTSNLVGVTRTYVEIWGVGGWINGEEFTETDFTIHVFQLPAGKTVTEIRLVFVNEGTVVGSMYVDFILFTSVNPFYTDEDLGDVFDIPQCKIGVNDQADFCQFTVDNHEGQHKTRFAYRDEAYLWLKKDVDWQRIFGGYIDTIDPESVQYGEEYLTLNMLGWSALLYERFIAEAYLDEDVDDVARGILDQADKQAVLGFTTFGIKDVQKKVDVLKCDYDPALSKLVEMAEQLDLCFHVEPNRDASLYPSGKRFLRYAGWMEDNWEKGWACTAQSFETDGDIAQIKTGSSGGTGTLCRTTIFSMDSTVFKKLLLELKGSDANTQYSVKVVTEDDVEYTVQALTAAPITYTVKEWDLTSIITGANKNVKNVKLGISKTGSQGILYFNWLGLFPETPPYQKVTLDTVTNIHAGAFQRDPKKARNMIIVKGDKFTYNMPLNSDEWCEPAYVPSKWGANDCTLTADEDAKIGTVSLKAALNPGSGNEFQRKSSGFILYDPFDTLDLTKYDKGSGGTGDGDTYVESGELVNKVKMTPGYYNYRRWIVTKDLKALNGVVVEVKIFSNCGPPTSDQIIFSPTHLAPSGDPEESKQIDNIEVYLLHFWGGSKMWRVTERKVGGNNVTHYENSSPTNPTTRVAKILLTESKVKVYLDDVAVCDATRVTSFTDAYLYLYGSTGNTAYQYPRIDNLKIYKGLKIYVDSLNEGWKVELWSGTYANPGTKQAEATVPVGSTIAELDVFTLTFPFTGFFKVFNPQGQEDHHSPDYSDIWGGDIYQAKQTTAVEHLIYFPNTKNLGMNALALKKLKFWMKHNAAEETCRLILATDDENYYYIDFQPVTKWKEEFEFNVGFMQNVEFEEIGSPHLKNINYIGFLYSKGSQVSWCKIDELRFEGETEAWGIAKDEESIAEIGLQPEKIFSSYYKTQEDAQIAADYWLSVLKNPPLVKGQLTHPWGLPQLRAGETVIINVANQNVNNEEMVIKEVIHVIPPASSKFTTEINLAGIPHALTDPQKRLKEHIDRLTKADVYEEKVEIFAGPFKERLSITDDLKALLEAQLSENISITDIIQALIDAKISDTLSVTDIVKMNIETTLTDLLSIVDAVTQIWEIKATDSLSITDLLKALIEAKITDSMSVTDYLQARWIWDPFDNKNDWTVELGTWSADGILHQTDTTVGGKQLKYTGGNSFPVNYTFQLKQKMLVNDQTTYVRFRRVNASNTYETDLVRSGTTKEVQLYRCVGGAWTKLAGVAKTVNLDTWYTLKTDQRNEGTGIRVKIWYENETDPCINYLEDPRSHASGDVVICDSPGVAGAKADFDDFWMWTE